MPARRSAAEARFRQTWRGTCSSVTCAGRRTTFASADELLLTGTLLDSPPPIWRAEVLRQMMARPPRAAWTQRIATVNEVVTWGILAMAASAVLTGQGSTAAYVAAFLTGGAAALLPRSVGKAVDGAAQSPVPLGLEALLRFRRQIRNLDPAPAV